MRTTIEISEEQHRSLSAIAQNRGLRGFSVLVQEALDSYLHNLDADEVELLLSLQGILNDEEEQEMRSRIEAARAVWRAS